MSDYKIHEMDDAQLAAARSRVDEIERWCKDIRAEALARARAGITLPGWKLVDGKMGARTWVDAGEAEAQLTVLVGDDAYQPRKVVTPPAAEKLLKHQPEVWSALQSNITQAEGSPSLVPDIDRRPARSAAPVEFDVVSN